jgi:hypothetical protein
MPHAGYGPPSCRRPCPSAALREGNQLGAALVTVALLGSAFVAIREAGPALSPGSLALGRLFVSVLVLGVAASFAPTLVGELGDAGATGIGWMVYSLRPRSGSRPGRTRCAA